jgi:REP element-mobilizing transposase RayT
VLVHLIFSTKNRARVIRPEIEDELFAYLASVCGACGCPAHRIGGTDDHVHVACSLSRTVPLSKLLEEIKKRSSKWIKTKGASYAGFSWQGGYGAFSIGQSQLATLTRYIAEQREHHRQKTFQEEFREFLEKYQIEYDERYVWD